MTLNEYSDTAIWLRAIWTSSLEVLKGRLDILQFDLIFSLKGYYFFGAFQIYKNKRLYLLNAPYRYIKPLFPSLDVY